MLGIFIRTEIHKCLEYRHFSQRSELTESHFLADILITVIKNISVMKKFLQTLIMYNRFID